VTAVFASFARLLQSRRLHSRGGRLRSCEDCLSQLSSAALLQASRVASAIFVVEFSTDMPPRPSNDARVTSRRITSLQFLQLQGKQADRLEAHDELNVRIVVARSAALLLAAGLGSVALPAAAQDFYAGAGVGFARYNVVCGAAGPRDKTATGWRLAAGWQADPAWGAELLYVSAGDFKAAGNSVAGKAEASGVGLAGSYRYALGNDMAIVARLGVASMKGKFTPNAGGSGASSDTSTQVLGGLSFAYDISKTVVARLDWDGTRVRMANDAGSLNLVSASLLLRF